MEEEELVQYMVVEQVFVVVMVVAVISRQLVGEVQLLGGGEDRRVVADFIEGVDLEEHLQPTKILITNSYAHMFIVIFRSALINLLHLFQNN